EPASTSKPRTARSYVYSVPFSCGVRSTSCAPVSGRYTFGELVRRYHQSLVATAHYLLGQQEDAEDIAQEALLTAYRKLDTLHDPGKFRAWLFTILRNACRDHYAHRHPEEVTLEEVAETLAAPTPLESHEIMRMLEALPLADREVLSAHYLQDLSFAEVAEALGITENAARVRCSRARERLRNLASNDCQLRAAMASFLLVPLDKTFSHRVLKEVMTMASTTTKMAAVGGGLATVLAGWKSIALVAGVAVVIGTVIAAPSVIKSLKSQPPSAVAQMGIVAKNAETPAESAKTKIDQRIVFEMAAPDEATIRQAQVILTDQDTVLSPDCTPEAFYENYDDELRQGGKTKEEKIAILRQRWAQPGRLETRRKELAEKYGTVTEVRITDARPFTTQGKTYHAVFATIRTTKGRGEIMYLFKDNNHWVASMTKDEYMPMLKQQ
ncbi:MAG TPA: sigma-70 family RNA polymerase sigma factor, partial [Armatimonadota bacterium]|nr:sigma-70 family RNA polymerase sigma factor [Armatimonadota bacterium]